MKKLLLAPLFLLASCAPILQTVQQEPATLARDAGALLFVNSGTETAEAPALLLSGNIETTDPNCSKRPSGRIGCAIQDVPPGQQYRLVYTGTLEAATVTFYKASTGTRPIYLQLP